MTIVRALPPVPCVMPNAVGGPRGNHDPRAVSASHEFQTLVKARIQPPLASHDPANPLAQAVQASDPPQGPIVEAMLQQLHACRKMRSHGAPDAHAPTE